MSVKNQPKSSRMKQNQKIKEKIARRYLHLLSDGDTEKIIALFSKNGIVNSPLYGKKRADEFYDLLGIATISSALAFKKIFRSTNSIEIALYFEYTWTVKSGKTVVFDVVDIIKFDHENKIQELTIVYDTAITRKLLEQMKKMGPH